MYLTLLWLTACVISSVSYATAFCTPPAASLQKPNNFEILNQVRIRTTQIEAASDDSSSVTSGKAALLKRELYQLAASYDRGFSATPKARAEASDIIGQLSALNPTTDASDGIDGNSSDDVPLRAIWRMIWTSALDVVSLGASPFAGEFENTSFLERPTPN